MALTKITTNVLGDGVITTEKLSNNTVANFANTASFAEVSARVDSAFARANTANVTSISAFAQANTANNSAISAAAGAVPKISSISIANSTYSVLDDTAVNVGGGYIVLTGTGFASGAEVLVGETPATSTTFVNSTTLRAQVPSANAGTYIVYVVNTDGGIAIKPRGLTYSGIPTWVTESTLANVISNTAFTGNLSATGATSYNVASGSTLPTGFNLVTANGYYYGSISVGSDTTYSFTIEARDAELQDSPRTFSLTALGVIPKTFSISPSVSGKSTWDLSLDGNLNLTDPGTWTITPTVNIDNCNVQVWGAQGSGQGGYSGCNFSLVSGTPYLLIVGNTNGTPGGGGGGGSSYGGSSGGGGLSGLFINSYTHANSRVLAGGGGGYGNGGGGGAGGGPSGGGGGGAGGGGGGSQGGGGSGGVRSSPAATYGGPGSALQGGFGLSGPGYANSGGGGGGYYGGGGGGVDGSSVPFDQRQGAGGGGGSGYIHPSATNAVSQNGVKEGHGRILLS